MSQANQTRPSRTLWMGLAVRAPQCASTIDETTILLGRTTCKRLDKEVDMNRYQYYDRGLSTWIENMALKSNVDSDSIASWTGWIKRIPDCKKLYQLYCSHDEIEWFKHAMFLSVLAAFEKLIQSCNNTKCMNDDESVNAKSGNSNNKTKTSNDNSNEVSTNTNDVLTNIDKTMSDLKDKIKRNHDDLVEKLQTVKRAITEEKTKTLRKEKDRIISAMNDKIDSLKKEIAKREATIRKHKQRRRDTRSRLYDVGFINIKNIKTMTQRQISNRKQKAKKYLSYLFEGQSQARGELAIMEIETNEDAAKKYFNKQKSTFIKGILFYTIIIIVLINGLSNMFKFDASNIIYQYNCYHRMSIDYLFTYTIFIINNLLVM